MCLAIPAMITKVIDDDMAIADVGGIGRKISLALVEGVAVGDYVIVHVGYALSRLDPKEAEKTLALFAEMNEAGRREAASRLP
ncbi:MAG: HypC/HybG/HupF family hydrogenase formation chaperone [Alphaproteobacteria bacterium]|nr:HypC/HybG/HupF family hydrogenase formation chaperone [Alphaproteobacteria bacterium]